MAREISQVDKEVIEQVVRDSLERLGMRATKDQASLLVRLILSGISYHFYNNPDTQITMGFMTFQKSPDLDELFSLRIIRDLEEKVVNADTLYKYYKGELTTEKKLKDIVEGFVDELLVYSQEQNMKITGLAHTLSTKSKSKNNGSTKKKKQ